MTIVKSKVFTIFEQVVSNKSCQSINLVAWKSLKIAICGEKSNLNQISLDDWNRWLSLSVLMQHGIQLISEVSKHASNIIENITSRSLSTVIPERRWFKTDDLMKTITFGQLYYASPVWMTNGLKSTSWRALNRAHYKALSAAFKDRWCEIHKEDLNRLSKRVTAMQWAKYSTKSCAIKLLRNAEMPLAIQMKNKMYVNDRKPHRGYSSMQP